MSGLFVISVLTGLLTVGTALPLLKCEAWWVRIFDFLRLQLIFLSAVLWAFEVAMLDRHGATGISLLVVTTVCLAYHTWWILPYTVLHPREVRPAGAIDASNSIGIMTANVLGTNRNSADLIQMVRANRPDILVTLETNGWWQSQLNVLENEYPHVIKCPQENLYGMHVYSKWPLIDGSIDYLVDADRPSIHTLVALPSGSKIRCHFLHPSPPSPTGNDSSRDRDAELLIVAKSVAKGDLPVVVAGDLNDVAWSATTRLFRKISGLLDPRIGRGMFNTYHAGHWYLRWPLDHVFHSDHFRVAEIRRLKAFGSDHFPLFARLVCDRKTESNQAGLPADQKAREWADKKIRDAEASEADVPRPGA
mgnify:CR=1 FL=1